MIQTSNFQRLNNIVGWLTFLIAAFVYLGTMEPTASFWDCGEYIACAYKLEVGHPPGAPLFLLIGNFFSTFASDPSKVGMMINAVSALCSAFTILFLFWTITAFARKIAEKTGELTTGKIYAILGSGLVGGLAYTFSDSFWFSAVEGEVYAMSSFFTALVFWCILRWEREANEPHGNRWIVLIAFLVGLSIGVHLLNLLAIPAIVFIYYFKKYNKITPKSLLLSFGISILILGGVMKGIIPLIVKMAAKMELFAVNTIGLPFNSGTIIFALVIIGGIVWGLHYSAKKMKPVINTVILCFTVLLIGYSSFVILVIRSQANTPMDENNPENAVNLLSYLNREQYGTWPILYGQYFSAPTIGSEDGSPVYAQDKETGKYVITDDRKNSIPVYDPKFCTIFPRMWSSQSNHVTGYRNWTNPRLYKKIKAGSESEPLELPRFSQNLGFFINYQMGWMYARYFLWNFVGRQNDLQGHGNNADGNWISGITALDESRLGPQNGLPDGADNNRAKNTLFFFPLILGFLGLVYQIIKDFKNAAVVILLFVFTGFAIVIYLNQKPFEPRERDYAYAASFYAFAIWIGLGVMAVFHSAFIKRLKSILITFGVIFGFAILLYLIEVAIGKQHVTSSIIAYIAGGAGVLIFGMNALGKSIKSQSAIAIIAVLICLLAVPTLMAKEEWDDHDRSKRYIARDFARNYLESCAPNAILFTNGDNDTFPLWYAQEVEGIRTDVRVICLELLNTDWYIDQMVHKAYDSDPVPFSFTKKQYVLGTRDVVLLYDKKIQGHIPVKELIEFSKSDDIANKLEGNPGEYYNYFPTRNLRVPVDSATVVNNGTIPKALANRIVKNIDWTISGNYIQKNDLMVIDLLAHNNWKRPIYFAATGPASSYLNLAPYLQLEGLAYRLVPVKQEGNEMQQETRIATDVMYDNVMKKFAWGGMDNKDVFLDDVFVRSCALNMRQRMSSLAGALIEEGKKDKAIKILDKCIEITPQENVPYDATIYSVIVSYYQAGVNDKANVLAKKLFDNYESNINYYYSFSGKDRASFGRDIEQAQDIMERLIYFSNQFKQVEVSKQLNARYNQLMQKFGMQPKMQQQAQ